MSSIYLLVMAIVCYGLALKGILGIAVGAWILAVALWYYVQEQVERNYEMSIPDGYPDHCLVKTIKYRFLFKRRKVFEEGITKEFYHYSIFHFYCLCICEIIGVLAMFISQRASMAVFIIYLGLIGVGTFTYTFCETKRGFLNRYKKLNIYNVRYLIGIYGKTYPISKKQGKCKVLSEYQKGKRTYVTVEMLESGEIKEKVIFSGCRKQGKNPTYTLYEICKVFYII